jgi:hypothetical protein
MGYSDISLRPARCWLTVSKRDSAARLARKSVAASYLAVCFGTQDHKDQPKIQNLQSHGHNLKAEQPTIINRCQNIHRLTGGVQP